VPLFYSVAAPMKLGLTIHYLDPLVRDMRGNEPFRAIQSLGTLCERALSDPSPSGKPVAETQIRSSAIRA
jgi:hypothetical protein